MKILVTGGAGYIGSHVCKALAVRGLVPITYDNLSRGHDWAVKWGPLEVGDLADTGRLQAIFERYQPSAIMHFAAYAYVGESMNNPLVYYQNNIAGSVALLRALCDWRVVPVVFSSTCATYGIPERVPISERHPQRPINPYGFSKVAIERILVDLDRAYGLRSVALRYFNAAGGDPDGEIGEAHDPEPHLIPRVLAAARDGTAISIYGSDYETPDGTCVRDYVHVVDIAEAHILALNYLLDGRSTCAFNLANSRGFSVLDVIDTAQRVTGRAIRVNMRPRRLGDPAILIGSADLAAAELGWQSKRSRLENQIEDAWRWMRIMPRCASSLRLSWLRCVDDNK